MQQDKLANYGFGFQAKLIASIMTDLAFTSQIYDLLKLEYFESESIKYIIDITLEYFKQNKKVPSADVLKVYINKLDDDLLKTDVINVLRESLQKANSNDLQFIKDTTIDFCKNQELKVAILKSVEYLKNGDYESIKMSVDSAMKVGLDSDIGLDYFDDVEIRYTEESRNPITTGWDVIDEIMKGGLAAGELGVVIAPSGAGKSWLLAVLGANAIKSGKVVVHYTLELSETYTGWRYDTILTGIPIDKIKNYKDDVKTKLDAISGKSAGKLFIKEYPMKSISLTGIQGHITKMKMLGINPDIIIIDYADLLKFGSKTMAKYEILESLYEELRGFAGEMKVPIWTVSQSNREGMNEDIIEADKAAGAYAKIFPADFVMSLSRKAQDKISNTARIHIIKNRFGLDGLTFPVHMDTSRGIVNIYNEDSTGGRGVSSTMQTDAQYDRARLRQRVQQLNTGSYNGQ